VKVRDQRKDTANAVSPAVEPEAILKKSH